MARKSIIFLLTLSILFSLFACDKAPSQQPDGEDTTAPSVEATPLMLSLDGAVQYSVVVPEGANESVLEASTALMDAVKAIAGRKPERKYDNTQKNPETEREILIGVTARKESSDMVKELQADEFLIERVGEKIVLLGANDYLLAQAVQTLIATWSSEGKSIALPATLSIRQDLSEQLLPLTDAKGFAYTLTYADGIKSDIVNEMFRFAGDVQELFGGAKPNVRKDSLAKADGTPEILIGHTDRPQSDAAYREMAGVGYHIAVKDGAITLAVTSNDQIAEGLRTLLGVLKTAKESTLLGDAKLQKTYTLQNGGAMHDKTWYTAVPALSEGIVTSGFSADASSCVIERENTTKEGFFAYVKKLESMGYAEGEDYTLGENVYTLRHGENATVYVGYSKSAGTTRLYVEKKGAHTYPEKGSAVQGAYEPVLWQLETDTKGAKENGGMSYVMRTAAGTFVVIDGGYYTEAEADHLYRFLREHTPEGKETVIEAWFISHLHWDHFGGMYAFSERYSNVVDVKSFYYRFDFFGKTNTKLSEFQTATSRNLWSDAVHYDGLQTGMQFYVSGIDFRVYYTLIDLYPVTAASEGFDFNDTSTVISASAGGEKIMFLGDVMDKGSEVLLKYMDPAALASDMVQYSHHGYEGASRAVYQAIRAEVVLWPMNVVGYQTSGYSSVPQNVFDYWHKRQILPNYYICYQASYVKKIIVSGMGDAQISLPYTPTGEKLPDFNAYYESHK